MEIVNKVDHLSYPVDRKIPKIDKISDNSLLESEIRDVSSRKFEKLINNAKPFVILYPPFLAKTVKRRS